jgi:hypothetical protein
MRVTKTSLVVALAGALVALGLAPPGLRAGEKAAAEKPASAAAKKPAAAKAGDTLVTIGGMRVAVDPKTGDLRPMTPAEARKLQDQMRKLFPERVVDAPTVRPDGSLSAVVAPNTLRFSVARVGAGGRLEIECTDGPGAALGYLKKAPSPTPEEK